MLYAPGARVCVQSTFLERLALTARFVHVVGGGMNERTFGLEGLLCDCVCVRVALGFMVLGRLRHNSMRSTDYTKTFPTLDGYSFHQTHADTHRDTHATRTLIRAPGASHKCLAAGAPRVGAQGVPLQHPRGVLRRTRTVPSRDARQPPQPCRTSWRQRMADVGGGAAGWLTEWLWADAHIKQSPLEDRVHVGGGAAAPP